MKLLAISDLHLGFSTNRRALDDLVGTGDDWLILAGDLGETEAHLRAAFDTLGPRFRRLIWVPGNHELYCDRRDPTSPRGIDKYQRLIDLCRDYDVLTPEDPYPTWTGEGGPHLLVPLFTLYDYSFRPPDVSRERALEWAAESGVVSSDEMLLDPHPFAGRDHWCAERVRYSQARLDEAPADLPTVLINHYPLRQDLVYIPRVPRYCLWCGTTQTHDWHQRYRARVVVSGHLHVPRTQVIDGVRFEEVSFGYPRQRPADRSINAYVRQILP
ncbi:MAG: metallophosphoesterase [Myxococcota bacterium]